jgi:hypothetical protein
MTDIVLQRTHVKDVRDRFVVWKASIHLADLHILKGNARSVADLGNINNKHNNTEQPADGLQLGWESRL